MNPLRTFLLALVVVQVGTLKLQAQDYVWVEAEAPARANVKFEEGGWGHPEYLSGAKWLHGSVDAKDLEKKVPPEGVVLSYEINVPKLGAYEVWGRVGYEFVRSPFRWRIDQRDWAENTPQDLTTDLMVLAEWTEVAWAALGKVQLEAGKHTLEVNFPRTYQKKNGKQEPNRILLGLDCFALVNGKFRPNGPFKPDQDWMQEIDKTAARQVFDVKSAPGPQRVVTPLSGVWQIARDDEQVIEDRAGPIRQLPENHEALAWKGVKVPGNRDTERPDLLYCHRYLYRTKIDVPAGSSGRSFVLRLPSTALIASVLVNGDFCGASLAPCANFECDITKAVRPGKVNEVCVAIKDVYYAIAQDGNGKSVRRLFNLPTDWLYRSSGLSSARFADFPVVLQVRGSGIFEPPTLITAGPAYVADVFAKPSLKKKQLGLEITLKVPRGKPLQVTVENAVFPLTFDKDGNATPGAQPAKEFEPLHLSLAPGAEKTVDVVASWGDPKLWWPDNPQQYAVRTRIVVDGHIIDEAHTKFGFREWGWSGRSFTLNGIPWNLHADLLHNGRLEDPEQAVKDWHKAGVNMVRYWGTAPWTGQTQEETLDFFDRQGMPVRRSGTFDGEGASYLLVETKNGKTVPRQDLFDHWRTQLRAWVKGERNHPSVFIWSVENEITYINTRNFGWLPYVEPEIKKAIDMVMALDPTRPAMIDGGDALRDQSLPIDGNHYIEFPMREYPDEAYTLKKAYEHHKTDPGANPWPITPDKPLFLGESFFVRGRQPSAYSELGGDAAFLGWPEARKGIGLILTMLAEGYRWHGVAATHFWTGPEDDAGMHHKAWQPVAVLCREWNWTFGSGQKVKRTLKLFNDTRFDDPIQLIWRAEVGGKPLLLGAGGFYSVKPGESKEITIELTMPEVERRQSGSWEFSLRRIKGTSLQELKEQGNKAPLISSGRSETVIGFTLSKDLQGDFVDKKPLWVIPRDGAPKPALSKEELAVYDPQGAAKARLQARGIAFTEFDLKGELPPRTKVLLIGTDALSPRQATDPMWRALAERGVRIVVLDQKDPLQYQAIPGDLVATEYVGRVAFPEDLGHPIFDGLGSADFFTWSGDHVVYRNAYKKGSKGAKSLVQCDELLSCSALAECPVRDGLLLLCQLNMGAKLATDPVAQRVFDNLLNYSAGYKPLARPTAVVFPTGDRRATLLDNAGLKRDPASDVLDALTSGKNEIVVADASPANLKQLAAHLDSVHTFTSRGGWLMLWGLTPEGLADYNRVVGQNHVIRPFAMERVGLAPIRDPLVSGLTIRDVVLESNKQMFPWAGDKYPADDEFTYIVDLDDIAPFAHCPTQGYGWAQMTNGLVSADSWKFIFSHNLKDDPHPKWTANLPKEEEITKFTIVPNLFYHVLTKLAVTFNGDPKTTMTLDLKPAMEKQTFAVPHIKAKSITLEPIAWNEVGKAPVLSIENLWIEVARSPSYRQEIVPLLNIGGLLKYKKGAGGIVLNQLRIQESEANPVNSDKKQTIAATLLRNLGAAFAGERSVVAGANLKYRPVPLDDKCNQFLTSRQGWFSGNGDLGHFPVGEQKLAGVSYLIRDFKTSPLPSCIMLAGPDAKGTFPTAVTGIPVGRKADVLFFLHTFHNRREWKSSNDPKNQPPTLFEYVIHYADGKTAAVPVRYGRGVGNWVASQPKGLPEAAVAWAASFPEGGHDGTQAVVFQMPWTNPHPEREIRAIDVRYDPKSGSAYGTPAVLAITSATTLE